MNRRRFLARMSMLAAASISLPPLLWAQSSPFAVEVPKTEAKPKKQTYEFIPLRRDVGAFIGKGGTIGWLCSSAGIVAVDTQFPETAGIFLKELPGRAGRRLNAVINTHHHSDHTAGNGVFKPVCDALVAQRKAPLFQLRWAELNRVHQGQVFPNTLYDDRWDLAVGDENVNVRFLGNAHTGADSVVLFEKANVVHLGDLVFNRLYPVIDIIGGGGVEAWLKVLEAILKDYPADAIYVFGHGKADFGVTGDQKDVRRMRDYLSALLDHVAKHVAAGGSKEALLRQANMPGFEDFHLPSGKGNRFPANLEITYDELTKTPIA